MCEILIMNGGKLRVYLENKGNFVDILFFCELDIFIIFLLVGYLFMYSIDWKFSCCY